MQIIASGIKKIVFGLTYLLIFGTVEILSQYLFRPSIIILYFLILFGLIAHSLLEKDKAFQSLWIALGLVPLIRITSIAMPALPGATSISSFIFISICLLAGIIMIMKVLGFSFADIGFKVTHPVLQIVIAIGGLFLGAIGYLILRPESGTGNFDIQSLLVPALVLLLSSGLEEIAFRGVMQHAAEAIQSFGWVFIAVIYAVIQISYNPPIMCIYILVISLLFGYIAQKGKSIIGISLAHGLFNIGLFLIFPYVIG